jgi:hypothetical protein
MGYPPDRGAGRGVPDHLGAHLEGRGRERKRGRVGERRRKGKERKGKG